LVKFVKKFNRTVNFFKNGLLQEEEERWTGRVSVYNLKSQIYIRGEAGGEHDHVDVSVFHPGVGLTMCILKPEFLDHLAD
jgi:hypothetical protein